MHRAILTTALLMALAGCDRTQSTAAPAAPPPDNQAAADGARQVNEMMAMTRADALEARVATLENQVDVLKAQADTRADLAAALAAPADRTPPVAPRPPAGAINSAQPD